MSMLGLPELPFVDILQNMPRRQTKSDDAAAAAAAGATPTPSKWSAEAILGKAPTIPDWMKASNVLPAPPGLPEWLGGMAPPAPRPDQQASWNTTVNSSQDLPPMPFDPYGGFNNMG